MEGTKWWWGLSKWWGCWLNQSARVEGVGCWGMLLRGLAMVVGGTWKPDDGVKMVVAVDEPAHLVLTYTPLFLPFITFPLLRIPQPRDMSL